MKKPHPVAPTLIDYAAIAARRPAAALPPDVSVVTGARNAAATLPRTIASVQAQRGPRIEHVVVDGASTDDSAGLLARRLRARDFWLI